MTTTFSRRWGPSALAVATLIAIQFAHPTASSTPGATIVGAAITLVAIAVLGYAIVQHLRHHLADPDAAVHGLVLMVVLVVAVFGSGYHLLEDSSPGQLAGLESRVDALYFTMSVLTTVGFGDIYAVGQVARVMVCVQLLFDVVFVAAIVSTIARRFGSRYRQDSPGGSG